MLAILLVLLKLLRLLLLRVVLSLLENRGHHGITLFTRPPKIDRSCRCCSCCPGNQLSTQGVMNLAVLAYGSRARMLSVGCRAVRKASQVTDGHRCYEEPVETW